MLGPFIQYSVTSLQTLAKFVMTLEAVKLQ